MRASTGKVWGKALARLVARPARPVEAHDWQLRRTAFSFGGRRPLVRTLSDVREAAQDSQTARRT